MAATEEDIAFYSNQLANGTTAERGLTLRDLAQHPTGDPRVVAAIEARLLDVEPVLLQIPLLYGEVRLLAAAALAAERSTAARPGHVQVQAVRPMTGMQIEQREKDVGISGPTGISDPVEAVLARWRRLRDHGALREETMMIGYPAHLSFLVAR
jgi:hypothetical protein